MPGKIDPHQINYLSLKLNKIQPQNECPDAILPFCVIKLSILIAATNA